MHAHAASSASPEPPRVQNGVNALGRVQNARKRVENVNSTAQQPMADGRQPAPYVRLNSPISAAFSSVWKLRLKPTTAAEVSAVTGRVSAATA